MIDLNDLKAVAKVTLTKLDDKGNVIGVEEQEVELTSEEAEQVWQLQQQH